MKIYVNNVEAVEEKLNLKKKIRFVRLIPLLCERRLREVVKKIPKDYGPNYIKKFEDETGIVLKYYVFEKEYEFLEHTKLGTYPNPKFNLLNGPIDIDEFMSYNLKDYDILVVINDKKLYKKD